MPPSVRRHGRPAAGAGPYRHEPRGRLLLPGPQARAARHVRLAHAAAVRRRRANDASAAAGRMRDPAGRAMPAGREMLYILSFYLPRFQNLDFREKLITVAARAVAHQPAVQRRHPPPRGPLPRPHRIRRAEYDDEMGRLADRWLALVAAATSCGTFSTDDFRQLLARHGRHRRPENPPPAADCRSPAVARQLTVASAARREYK